MSTLCVAVERPCRRLHVVFAPSIPPPLRILPFSVGVYHPLNQILRASQMSRSDVGPKGTPMDRRPTSPLLSESGLRSAAESYLHFRSHSRTGSTHSASDATPTPSASALRRAQALAAGDVSAASSSSKLSSILHNLQQSSRHGSTSHLAQPQMRTHSRSDSGLAGAGSGSASPLPSHSVCIIVSCRLVL
jgi:hypothetical protein